MDGGVFFQVQIDRLKLLVSEKMWLKIGFGGLDIDIDIGIGIDNTD